MHCSFVWTTKALEGHFRVSEDIAELLLTHVKFQVKFHMKMALQSFRIELLFDNLD